MVEGVRRGEKEVERFLHMTAGNGKTSYARNSIVQNKIISISKPVIVEAIEGLLSRSLPEIMTIADLGCSSGPNTLNAVWEIMDVVHEGYIGYGRSPPELKVFLNDLYGNDFNNVFQSLPTFLHKIKTEKGSEFARKCAIFGAPGSFYGKLFPSKSLHFVHSSSSLHWLSQVPPCLDKEAKEAMNKGAIYISKSSPPCVLEAYAEQFHQDFSALLKSRSEEIVKGGRMVLSFMGRKSRNPKDDICPHFEMLGQALMSLVSEGLLDEEKVDCFNVSYYAPCKEEVEVAVKREGSFILDRCEAFEIVWDGGSVDKSTNEFTTGSSGRRVAKMMRAVTESMLKSHFGGETMDELFKRYEKIVQHRLPEISLKKINLIISLTMK